MLDDCTVVIDCDELPPDDVCVIVTGGKTVETDMLCVVAGVVIACVVA